MCFQYAIRRHASSDMNRQEEVKQVSFGVMIHLKRYSRERMFYESNEPMSHGPMRLTVNITTIY